MATLPPSTADADFSAWGESIPKQKLVGMYDLFRRNPGAFKKMYQGTFHTDFDPLTQQEKIVFRRHEPNYSNDDAADAASYANAATQEQYTEWYNKNSANPEKPVSNKFLPFIVESSTPIHIFKTLLSRSKGMNQVLVASIFNLTLHIKITKLREFVKSLPEMPLESTYEELLTKYPQHRITDESLDMFSGISRWMVNFEDKYNSKIPLWDEKLKEFDDKDVMMFFCVISKLGDGQHEFSSIQFQDVHKPEKIFNNLQKHIKLSDSADQKCMITSASDLASFISFIVNILPQLPNSEPPPPIHLVWGTKL